MDSCQLIRKETNMDIVHLNQKQLAARWRLRISANVTGDFGNVTDLRLGAGLRG